MRGRAGKTRDEAGQFEEVREAHERTPFAHRNLQLGGNQVRPLRRHGANGQLINLQQEPLAVAVEALAYADQLPPAERMERMRDAYKACRSDGNACIPN